MMPPKTTFRRDEVLQAALDIVKEKGLRHLTARRVAERLNASTAPVYSSFRSMRVLSREVLKKAKELLLEYATRPYTDHIFLNMGIGVVLFARDQNGLYRALFLEKGTFKDVIDDINAALRKQMDREEGLAALSEQNKDWVLEIMSIFTHGLASQVCVGLVEDARQDAIGDILKETGTAIIQFAMNKDDNTSHK
jgi:AcrR family transcriptional regulator